MTAPKDAEERAAFDNSAEIAAIRDDFASELRRAHQHAGKAHTLLDVLRSDQVFVEGTAGVDMAAHLGDAARSLRAALAIAAQVSP